MFDWIIKRNLKSENRELKQDICRFTKFKITFKTCTGEIIEYDTDLYYNVKFDFVDRFKTIDIEDRKYPINSMEWITYKPIGEEVYTCYHIGYYSVNEEILEKERELKNNHIERCNKYGVDCIFGKELIL